MSVDDLMIDVRAAARVYIIGNGGSAANALHIANDLIAAGIRAHALTGDIATITATANDAHYSEIFARSVLTYGEKGDLLIALSGSGNSENIIAALYAAQDRGMNTWAILGAFTVKPKAAGIARHHICVGHDMQAAEEAQLRIGHEVMRKIGAT